MQHDCYTVHEVLDSLSTHLGREIHVTGHLAWEFENHSLNHWPESNWRAEQFADGHANSIWVEMADNYRYRLNADVLSRMDRKRKRVVVSGTLLGPEPDLAGCGHLSLWKAFIAATRVDFWHDWVNHH